MSGARDERKEARKRSEPKSDVKDPKGRRRKDEEEEEEASPRKAESKSRSTPSSATKKKSSTSDTNDRSAKRQKLEETPSSSRSKLKSSESAASAKSPKVKKAGDKKKKKLKLSKSLGKKPSALSPSNGKASKPAKSPSSASGKKDNASSSAKKQAKDTNGDKSGNTQAGSNARASKSKNGSGQGSSSKSSKSDSRSSKSSKVLDNDCDDGGKLKNIIIRNATKAGDIVLEGEIHDLDKAYYNRYVGPLLEALEASRIPESRIAYSSVRVVSTGPKKKNRAVYRLSGTAEWLEPNEVVLRLLGRPQSDDPIPLRKRPKSGKKASGEEDKVLEDDVAFTISREIAFAKNAHQERLSKIATNQVKIMAETVEKMCKMDEYGMFTGDSSGRRVGAARVAETGAVASGPLVTLYDLMRKVRNNEYVDTNNDALVGWDEFINDLSALLDARVEIFGDSDAALITGSTSLDPEEVSKKLKAMAVVRCEAAKRQLSDELEKVKRLEMFESLGPNREPAMTVWRKELLKAYPYRLLHTYEPADGLLPEEKEQLLEKLTDTSGKGNRWVHPDGLDMLPLWLKVVALDRGDRPDKPVPSIADALPAECVVEQPTWGIDCFGRRHIESFLVINGYSLEQIRYFVELVLLRALNAVRPIELGWDVTKALQQLIADIDERGLRTDQSTSGVGSADDGPAILNAVTSDISGDSGSSEEEDTAQLMYARVKVTKGKKVRSGRIIGFRAPFEYNIMYDDDNVNSYWEDLSSPESYEVLDRPVQKQLYETLEPEQIREIAALLLEHVPKHERNFAVHSKGTGVVTKVPITAGRLIQKYTGLLYPCWLWEEKESKEDDERLQHKRETGEVILPDFWNMRLELPKGQDDRGIDLLHVDAKLAGNFSSRMSHSCRPNCGTMTAVINGQYCVGMRALRDIEAGEELTIDYNCVTDSLDEFRAAICLCGAHDCRGSFLYTMHIDPQHNSSDIVDRSQGPLYRVAMLFSACYETGELERVFGGPFTEYWPRWVSPEERKAVMETKTALVTYTTIRGSKRRGSNRAAGEQFGAADKLEHNGDAIVRSVLAERGFGMRALVSLPDWALRFAAHVVEFIDCEELERTRADYTRRMVEEKDAHPDNVWRISELESKGVADQRVTNLVIAVDKARHHMCERVTRNSPVLNNCESEDSTAATTTDRNRLRERWWVSDRCFARWVGDDASDYPDWYPAEVTHVYVKEQELRVVYDTEEINRIPFSMARRPPPNEIPSPHTGCDVLNHQPPFRVLSEPVVAHFLLLDVSSGICARLVKRIEEVYKVRGVALWQSAIEETTRKPYWWNFQTRQLKQIRPSEKDLKQRVPFEPKALDQIKRLVEERRQAVQKLYDDDNPKAGEQARKVLAQLRDLILKLPVPPGEPRLADMNQKAADLLTLLSMTRNFFTLHEPESDTTNSHAVINALTSWVNQGLEARMPDITEMIGTALLPPIERAYDDSCGLGYCGVLRNQLCAHLRLGELKDWPKQIVSMFPKASEIPPQPPDAEKQWPYPVPPVRLFGTPALDSAIYNHLDYTKTCAYVRYLFDKREPLGRAEVNFKPERGRQNLREVAALLKEKTIDRSKVDSEDRAKVEPPSLPVQSEWVQCEHPDCGKWRKLPIEITAKDVPSPFYCECLAARIDPAHGSCDAAEEQEQGTVVILDTAAIDLNSLTPGHDVDAFDLFTSEWKMATVLETNDTAIKIKYLVPPGIGPDSTAPTTEWVSRQPDPSLKLPRIAPLNTYTVKRTVPPRKPRSLGGAVIGSRVHLHPYQHLVPEADAEVARYLNGLIIKVEDEILGPAVRLKQIGPPRREEILKLESQGFSSEWDHNTRSGFTNFFVCNRSVDPLIPFVTLLARWSTMDSEQRNFWVGKDEYKLDTPLAVGRIVEGPAFLSQPTSKKTNIRCVELPRHSAPSTFVGETDSAIFGLPLETAYGKGFVVAADDSSVEIRLTWGAKMYVPRSRFRVEAPLFLAYPKSVSKQKSANRKRLQVSEAFAVPLPKLEKKKKRDEKDSRAKRRNVGARWVGDDENVNEGVLHPYPDAPTPEVEAVIDVWRRYWMHVQDETGKFLELNAVVKSPEVRVYDEEDAMFDETGESDEGDNEESMLLNSGLTTQIPLPPSPSTVFIPPPPSALLQQNPILPPSPPERFVSSPSPPSRSAEMHGTPLMHSPVRNSSSRPIEPRRTPFIPSPPLPPQSTPSRAVQLHGAPMHMQDLHSTGRYSASYSSAQMPARSSALQESLQHVREIVHMPEARGRGVYRPSATEMSEALYGRQHIAPQSDAFLANQSHEVHRHQPYFNQPPPQQQQQRVYYDRSPPRAPPAVAHGYRGGPRPIMMQGGRPSQGLYSGFLTGGSEYSSDANRLSPQQPHMMAVDSAVDVFPRGRSAEFPQQQQTGVMQVPDWSSVGHPPPRMQGSAVDRRVAVPQAAIASTIQPLPLSLDRSISDNQEIDFATLDAIADSFNLK